MSDKVIGIEHLDLPPRLVAVCLRNGWTTYRLLHSAFISGNMRAIVGCGMEQDEFMAIAKALLGSF